MRATTTKVVHLSTVHSADDVRIFHKECRSLRAAGYDVTLIARADRDAVRSRVKIRAIREWPGNRFARMTLTTWRVFRMALDERADVYHFHDPELIPIGIALKLRGKRVIYDVHENVAKQIHSKPWIPARLQSPVSYAVRTLERLATSMLDGVVAATPGIASVYPRKKTAIVQNFVLVDELASISTEDYRERTATVVYLGGITRERGGEEMVRAMERAGSECRARMLLGGSFQPASLQADLETEPGYARVDFVGWLDRNGVRDALARGRLGMLVLHPEPNYVDSYPVKLFEYMAAGLPVIASDFPFWRQFVAETGCGIMVDPKNTDQISDAIIWLLRNPDEALRMGRKGREAVLKRYSWDREAQKLLELYSRVSS